jgi:hypothetical protein
MFGVAGEPVIQGPRPRGPLFAAIPTGDGGCDWSGIRGLSESICASHVPHRDHLVFMKPLGKEFSYSRVLAIASHEIFVNCNLLTTIASLLAASVRLLFLGELLAALSRKSRSNSIRMLCIY